jgi:hypothetical protein
MLQFRPSSSPEGVEYASFPHVPPNSEAAAELARVLADKEARLSQLREQADALETQIKKDQDRLTTVRSGPEQQSTREMADSPTPTSPPHMPPQQNFTRDIRPTMPGGWW